LSGQPLRVLGLSELVAALNAVDRDLAKDLRRELRDAGEVVARGVREKLMELFPSPVRSAAGVVVRVRPASGTVTVEQKYRKTTGKRPDWGVTQMKDAFLPAAEEEGDLAKQHIEAAIDNTARDHGF
jgi:hypothetical protein